ncbi:MAG: NADH-quinone oxidoreductase subunit NuoK [Anaerolineae bacterium]
MPILSSGYVVLSAVLFCIGVLGVLLRRSVLVTFMSIEIMLNAVNVALVGLGALRQTLDGQVLVLLVMAVAAAEVAVGLALIVIIYRGQGTTDVDEFKLLKG